MLTIAQIASQIAKLEGKKSQARIGDIRETLKLLVQMEAASQVAPSDSPLQVLQERADKLAKKKL